MKKLKSYKFSDLYTISSGISTNPDQAGHGYPFVSFSTVFNNYFMPENLLELMQTSESERKTFSVKKGDIFLTRTSETLDELCMSCVSTKDIKNATFSGFLKRLRPNQTDKTYHIFMGFYLRSEYFRKMINNNAVMTLRASFNEKIYSYLKLLLPDYKSQKKIGDFLYLIQQKIEINNKLNSQLEAIANLIYDYWFVQFDFPDKNGIPYKSSGREMIFNEDLKIEIPHTWSVRNISEKMKIISGYPFKSDSYLDSGTYKIVTIKNVQDNRLELNNTDFVDSIPDDIDSSCILKAHDILISLTGNVGRICLVDEQSLLLNQRVGKFQTDPVLKNYFYLTYRRPEFRSWLERISSGTSQKNLSPIDAVNRLHPFPDSSTLIEFEKLVGPMIKKILLNLEESRRLETLRNWLLPMLMNGQVTVC